MRSTLAAVTVLAVTIGALTGCDFFQELESDPDAGDGTGESEGEAGETGASDGTGETGDEPCGVLDEYCSDQDTLHSCDAQTGELLTYPCATVCGSSNLLNFTCTPTATFLHACWCVNPGAIKIDTCAQLDTCVVECGDPDSACAGNCFTKTDAQTVRLLGSLYSCADRACDEVCKTSPYDCGSCLLAAKAGLWGDCGVAREVCDADEGDEPSWP